MFGRSGVRVVYIFRAAAISLYWCCAMENEILQRDAATAEQQRVETDRRFEEAKCGRDTALAGQRTAEESRRISLDTRRRMQNDLHASWMEVTRLEWGV